MVCPPPLKVKGIVKVYKLDLIDFVNMRPPAKLKQKTEHQRMALTPRELPGRAPKKGV